MIVSVTYSADGHSGDWNADLSHPDFGLRAVKLSDRAIDDAVFHANELRDMGPMNDLCEFRAKRARAIQEHFAVCANKLIGEIESGEGWGAVYSRLTS